LHYWINLQYQILVKAFDSTSYNVYCMQYCTKQLLRNSLQLSWTSKLQLARITFICFFYQYSFYCKIVLYFGFNCINMNNYLPTTIFPTQVVKIIIYGYNYKRQQYNRIRMSIDNNFILVLSSSRNKCIINLIIFIKWNNIWQILR